MVNLIIQVDAKARYIIEPGSEALSYILNKLKIHSNKELKSALSKGKIAEILGVGSKHISDIKKINEIKQENKRLKENIKYSEEQTKIIKEKQDVISKLNGEKSHLEDNLRVAYSQLKDAREKAWIESNPGLQ